MAKHRALVILVDVNEGWSTQSYGVQDRSDHFS